MREPVKVPAAVLEGIEACWEDGRHNMFSWRSVAHLAGCLGYPATTTWIEQNSTTYFLGILDGFEADTPDLDLGDTGDMPLREED